MRTIIAPTDFSSASLNAVNYAVDMAKAIDANVVLMNVYNIPITYTDIPLVLVSVEELKKTSESRLEGLARDITHITSGQVKVQIESRMGNIVDELKSLCNDINPFAIVMGAKNKTGIENLVFGSTTIAAIRHLTWPVICVPQGREYGKGIKKIGYACDFKQVSENTPVGFIKEMVKAFNAELHILNVDYNNKYFWTGAPRESYLLHSMLKEVKPQHHYVVNENVENGINEFAETNNLDLVITIPHKHTLLRSIFNESTSRHLVFHSHIPVMCVHE